jgi:hypothetical protein
MGGERQSSATITVGVRVDLRRLPDDWSAEDEALLQAIDDATATPIHIAYALGAEWSDGIHAVIDRLEARPPRPDVAIELVERMLARVVTADVDDSDGWTVQFCQRLLPLHAAAAEAVGLDADGLAARTASFGSLGFDPFTELG